MDQVGFEDQFLLPEEEEVDTSLFDYGDNYWEDFDDSWDILDDYRRWLRWREHEEASERDIEVDKKRKIASKKNLRV